MEVKSIDSISLSIVKVRWKPCAAHVSSQESINEASGRQSSAHALPDNTPLDAIHKSFRLQIKPDADCIPKKQTNVKQKSSSLIMTI